MTRLTLQLAATHVTGSRNQQPDMPRWRHFAKQHPIILDSLEWTAWGPLRKLYLLPRKRPEGLPIRACLILHAPIRRASNEVLQGTFQGFGFSPVFCVQRLETANYFDISIKTPRFS